MRSRTLGGLGGHRAKGRTILNGSVRTWDIERLSIWNGCFAMAGMSIVNNFVAMYMVDALHATDNEMGLLNSLPSLVNLFSMAIAAILLTRARSKRKFCVAATSLSRSFYIYIAIVPFIIIQQPALWVVWLVALTRLPQSFGDLSWQALISDLIPTSRRSVFFSERNRITTIVGLIVTLGVGLFLQQFSKSAAWPYQLVFIITVIFAILEIISLWWHDDSAVLNERSQTVIGISLPMIRFAASALAKNRGFLLATGALLLFNFSWQLAWPLFNIYQLSVSHATATWVGLFAVASQASQILTYRWWGRKADLYGNRRILGFAAVGMASVPILTILSTNMFYLTAVNLLSGIPLAGINLLLFNYLLEICPVKERTAYIGLYNVALSVVGFVAPEIGILLLHSVGMTIGMSIASTLRLIGGASFFLVGFLIAKKKGGPNAEIGLSL